MVPEAGTGHWEHSPACLATSAASFAVPITLCHPHHISPAPPACQGPEQSHQLFPDCQPSPPGLPEPALQPPSLKPERALCVLSLLSPSRLQAGWKQQGSAEEPYSTRSSNLEMLDLMDGGSLPTHSNTRARQGCSGCSHRVPGGLERLIQVSLFTLEV